jgi:hypothetical protein
MRTQEDEKQCPKKLMNTQQMKTKFGDTVTVRKPTYFETLSPFMKEAVLARAKTKLGWNTNFGSHSKPIFFDDFVDDSQRRVAWVRQSARHLFQRRRKLMA